MYSYKDADTPSSAVCSTKLASAFRTHILQASKEADSAAHVGPVRVLGSCSFMYMRHNDVYLLAVTKSNANAMLAFQFMTQVCIGCMLHCSILQRQPCVRPHVCLPAVSPT